MHELDRAFFALANQPRREIVAHLAKGPATRPELGRLFDFSKQALGKHVAVLEQANMVSRRTVGRAHELRLSPRALERASSWIDSRRRVWERNLDRLATVLEGDDE